MNPTDTIIALEKALEGVFHPAKEENALAQAMHERDARRYFNDAANPLAIRTLLDAHASALRDAAKHKRMADILFSSMQLVRQYPDFDGRDGEVNLLGDVMDAAMRGEVHNAVQFIAEIHANYEFQRNPAALDDNTKGAA